MASSLLSIAAPLALSYFGAPPIFGSTTLGGAALGAGAGALTGGGLKGALLGGIAGGLAPNLGDIAGGLGLGDVAGTPLSGGLQGPTRGSGLAGTLSTGGTSLPSIGGLTGGSAGGGSTFSNTIGLTNALGGFQENSALEKAKKQLLAGNTQQLQNLESFDPSGLGQDPGYQFKVDQGQEALNRSLGSTGNLFSGRALKAASELNQNLAGDEFDDYYQRWLNKTGAQNALYGNSGDIRAASTIGKSNSLSKALAGL